MGDGDCDLGVTLISYKTDRNTFIDYTMPVEEDGVLWVSKAPQKLPSFTNIIKIFDFSSWLCILISIVLVTLALVISTWHRESIQYHVLSHYSFSLFIFLLIVNTLPYFAIV